MCSLSLPTQGCDAFPRAQHRAPCSCHRNHVEIVTFECKTWPSTSQNLREGVPPPEASQRLSISSPVLQGLEDLPWPVLQQRSQPWCRRASCCPATAPAKANITPCKFITKSGAEAKHNALLVGGSVETRLFPFFFSPPSSWKGG